MVLETRQSKRYINIIMLMYLFESRYSYSNIIYKSKTLAPNKVDNNNLLLYSETLKHFQHNRYQGKYILNTII